MHLHKPGCRFGNSKGILLGALLISSFGFRPATATATTTNVNVGDNFFSPSKVSIKVNDTVRWTWTGIRNHSATSNSGLWDSGLGAEGKVFSHTFTSPGSFPYRCSVHSLQTGTIAVLAASNAPPSVTIVSPTPGAVFAAPWSGNFQVNATDANGTISRLDFYLNDKMVSMMNNPGTSSTANVAQVSAGDYQLKVVVTDNLGATNTSAVVSVNVLEPTPIALSSAERISPTAFRFSYSGTPGLGYVVNRSSNLVQWTALATNIAAAASNTFLDNGANAGLNYYSVSLRPNP